MEKNIYNQITEYVKSGPSNSAIAEMVTELVEQELIRFDEYGNPYWTCCGEKVGAGDFE